MSAYQLSVVMPASFIGPQVVAYFRNWSVDEAITDLSQQVPPADFINAFGAAFPSLLRSHFTPHVSVQNH